MQRYHESENTHAVITVEDNQLGCHYKVNARDVLLYSTPPAQALLNARKSTKKLHSLGPNVFPAIQIDTRSKEQCGVHEQLTKGQVLLARDVPSHPGIVEVVLFEENDNNNPDMPETGDGIQITQKGYVVKSQLTHLSERFVPNRHALFPHDDLVEDVKQYKFGNCFLLSSIISILHQQSGKQYIKNMMVQDGDYVIVRLYDPNTKQPCFIRVKNSTYYQDGSSMVLHRAPWVHILEKAYAAFAIKQDADGNAYQTYPAFREMYGAGGTAKTAYTVLTGKDAHTESLTHVLPECPWEDPDIKLGLPIYILLSSVMSVVSREDLERIENVLSENPDFANELFSLLLPDNSTDQTIKNIEDLERKHDLSNGVAQFFIQYRNEENGMALLASYIKKRCELYQKGNTELYSILTSIWDFYLIGEYQLAHMNKKTPLDDKGVDFSDTDKVQAYFIRLKEEYPDFPEEIIRKFKSHIYSNKASDLNGPLGSNRYSDKVSAVYDDIKSKLASTDHHYCLAAGSKSTFKDHDEVAGLRPGHGYAIEGVYERETDRGSKVKMVRLSNPWGRVGRRYDLSRYERRGTSYVTEDKDLGTFDVELTDFCRYFKCYTVGSYQSARPVRDCVLHSQPKPKPKVKQSFIKRHRWKIALGVTLGVIGVAAFVAASILFPPLGLGLAGSVAVVAGAVGTTIGVTAAKIVGIAVAGVVAGCVVGAIGSILGGGIDSVTSKARTKKASPHTRKRKQRAAQPDACHGGSTGVIADGLGVDHYDVSGYGVSTSVTIDRQVGDHHHHSQSRNYDGPVPAVHRRGR